MRSTIAVAAILLLTAACGDAAQPDPADNVACPLLTEAEVESVMGSRLEQRETATRTDCVYGLAASDAEELIEFVSLSMIGGTADDFLQSATAARTAFGAERVDDVTGVGEAAIGWDSVDDGYTIQAYQTDRLVIVTVVSPSGSARAKAEQLANLVTAKF